MIAASNQMGNELLFKFDKKSFYKSFLIAILCMIGIIGIVCLASFYKLFSIVSVLSGWGTLVVYRMILNRVRIPWKKHQLVLITVVSFVTLVASLYLGSVIEIYKIVGEVTLGEVFLRYIEILANSMDGYTKPLIVETALGLLFLGSSLFIFLVNNFSRKSILIFFVFVKACLLFCFKLTSVGYLLILTRFFIGIVHMPLTIYIPIWIDQFAISKYKTLFMTILQVAMPTGKVAGYLLPIIFAENNWQMGFVFEGCYLSFVGFVVLCVPSNYFSANLFVAKPNDDLKHKLVLNAKRSSNVTEFQFISSTQDKAVAQQKEKKSLSLKI
jgi:hypothetical protein